jgi:hypothetical protein
MRRYGLVWIALVCGAVAACNHFAYARGHRLFYDEDVYANMSHNLAAGFAGGVTASWLPGAAKRVDRGKWPLGFPVLVLPWIAALGAEDGPAACNEWIGLATAFLIGFLAARWTGSGAAGIAAVLLFGLNPIAAGWYRSGSAEPAGVMLALASIAIAESSGGRPWLVPLSLTAAFLAINVRLENAVLAIPLSILFVGRSSGLARRHIAAILVLTGPLAAALAANVPTLVRHYLTGRPESRFAAGFVFPNIAVNLRFLRGIGLAPLFLLGFGALVYLSMGERRWLALLGWLGAQAALLSFYSVGRYSAPGGSRFLLAPSAALALSIVGLLARWPERYRSWGLAAGLTACCLSLPGRGATWGILDGLNTSPRLEHEAVRRWARDLPPGSVVISAEPYLWEANGVFTLKTGLDAPVSVTGPLYWHRSLFQIHDPLPPGAPVVGTVRTPDGDVSLVRIR